MFMVIPRKINFTQMGRYCLLYTSYMRADDSSHNIAEPFILKENERLGFVFPVHGWRVPRLVREFIRKMKKMCIRDRYTSVGIFAFPNVKVSIYSPLSLYDKTIRFS